MLSGEALQPGLETLLVCPVCRGELPLSEVSESRAWRCSRCGCRYETGTHAAILIPEVLPHRAVRRKWNAWVQLQENGLVYYEADPEHNLSVGERADVEAFATFCKPAGLVLDIGCGPQSLPSYWKPVGEAELIGIDPLSGEEKRAFGFVQGIGEYLPFRSDTFDQVLMASSLDHALAPRRVLREARRVLKGDGRLSLWFFDVDTTKRTFAQRCRDHRRRIARRLRKLGRVPGILMRGGPSALLVKVRRRLAIATANGATGATPHPADPAETLTVPSGAADAFHIEYCTTSRVFRWLSQTGYSIRRVRVFERSHVFVEAVPASRPVLGFLKRAESRRGEHRGA